MRLTQMAGELEGARIAGGDAEIASLCADSRVIVPGDVFFCYAGAEHDSHAFAQEAERRGAAAIVCEREVEVSCPQLLVRDGREAMARMSAAFYGHPEREMKMIGVTGTNGKTTTVCMIDEILKEAGIRTGRIGTLGAKYGGVEVAPALTTPDPITLFSLLAEMRRSRVRAVAMEVSAHALALRKECPIVYDVAVFTNLTQDHLDFFGSMERYGEAKRRMFDRARSRFAVINADDAFSRQLSAGGVPCVTYGLDSPADCFALVESDGIRGCRALLNLNDELIEVSLPLTGRHNVCNALAAACAARRLGAGAEEIARGLAAVHVEGRLERVATFRGAEVFVDFAHTPDGLRKSLSALREHCSGRLIVLFGCGGNRDRGKRAVMGETAASLCDFAVLTSDNPRYEDPCAIIAEIERGYLRRSKEYVTIEEREKATEYALRMLGEGDVLLVAGKGGETYQEIMGIKSAYRDKDVIVSLLEKMR